MILVRDDIGGVEQYPQRATVESAAFDVLDHSIELSELDLLCASSGPGSFTGLRIALATMKGLALGLNKPLVSVPTLDLFQGIARFIGGACLAVIDAKKQRFYTALFVDGIKIGESSDLSPDEIASLIAPTPPLPCLAATELSLRSGWQIRRSQCLRLTVRISEWS